MKNTKTSIEKQRAGQALVDLRGEKITTSSLIVAEKLGKRHDNVVQKIDKLIAEDTISFLNFKERNGVNSRGKEQRYYEMDRDSFSILMMGFTGKKAFQWKISFLKAFNQMERELIRRQSASFQEIRLIGKTCRRSLTDAIQSFVEVAEEQGSKNAHRYYTLFTRLIYRELLETNDVPGGFRDGMTDRALTRLSNIEDLIAEWIVSEAGKCEDYHAVYQSVKGRLKRYIEVTGSLFPAGRLAA